MEIRILQFVQKVIFVAGCLLLVWLVAEGSLNVITRYCKPALAAAVGEF